MRIHKTFIALLSITTLSFADYDQNLVQLHYDLEVASYCGAVSENALKGFKKALHIQVETRNFSQNDIEQARMQAWKDAHWEWQNRGLGGFKNWCANDAMEGVRRLESYLEE